MLGHRGEVDRAVGAGDDEFAALEDDVVARRLHHVSGDAAALVDQFVGRHDDGRAGKLCRARTEGADPHRHQIAVAKAVADQIGVDAEFFRQYLLERRAVALAVIHAPGHQHHTARRVEADPGSAKPSSRAATLTPSPKISPSSTTMSPTLIPIRNSMRRSDEISAFRWIMLACTSTAQRSASTTLRNSTRKPSPVVLTSRPLCRATI